MGDLGLMGMVIPERWGGSGAGAVAYVVALEEIAKGVAAEASRTSCDGPWYRPAWFGRTPWRSPEATTYATAPARSRPTARDHHAHEPELAMPLNRLVRSGSPIDLGGDRPDLGVGKLPDRSPGSSAVVNSSRMSLGLFLQDFLNSFVSSARLEEVGDEAESRRS